MSRTNSNRNESLPNPVKSIFEVSPKGQVRFYNKEKKKEVFLIDLFEKKTDQPMNELIYLDKPLKMLFIDDSFFIKAYDKPRSVYATSTDYNRVSDQIAVFENGNTSPVWKGIKDESKDFFSNYSTASTCMNIIFMSPVNKEICRLELAASGRGSFFDFKKSKGIYKDIEKPRPLNDYGFISLVGFMRVLQSEDDKEKTIFIPVFQEVEETPENTDATKLLIDEAIKNSEEWDKYLDSKKIPVKDSKQYHPYNTSKADKDKEPLSEEDQALINDLNNLPTVKDGINFDEKLKASKAQAAAAADKAAVEDDLPF